MAKNKSSKARNKKYVPKYENKLPTVFKLTQTELNELKNKTQGMLASLRAGHGDLYAWRDIVWRLVVGREIAIKYFHEEEACELFHEAVRHAIRVYRAHEGGSTEGWAISADDARIFHDACELSDSMIPQLTRREYTQASDRFANMPLVVLAKQDISWADYKANFVK